MQGRFQFSGMSFMQRKFDFCDVVQNNEAERLGADSVIAFCIDGCTHVLGSLASALLLQR